MASKIVLERYTPDEASKRATFRMLAEYYCDLDEDAHANQTTYDVQDRAGGFHVVSGEEEENGTGGEKPRRRPSPGAGLLARMHRLSPAALDKDGEAQLTDPEAGRAAHTETPTLKGKVFLRNEFGLQLCSTSCNEVSISM